ncbi:MAG: O-antigen ligase family protein, partial [Calditrichia bacterium]
MAKKNKRPDILPLTLLIVGAVFIIPFSFSMALIDSVFILRYCELAALLFILYLLLSRFWNKQTPSLDLSPLRQAIFPLFTGYVIISALSIFIAYSVPEALLDSFKNVMLLFFFIAAVIIISQFPQSIPLLTRSIVSSALVMGIIGLAQYFKIAFTSLPGNFVIYATMTNKNIFASFMFFTLPFSLYGYFFLEKWWRVPSAISLLVSLLCIVLATARAVWVAILIGGIAAAIAGGIVFRKQISSPQNRQKLKKTAWSILVVFFLALILYFVNMKTINFMVETKVRGAINLDSSSYHRLLLWKKSLQMIKDHPLLGVGPGNWKIFINGYGTAGLTSAQGKVLYQRPHNDYLWIASESGILSLLLYLAFLGMGLFYQLRILKRFKNIDEQLLGLFLFFGTTGFIVISFFSFPRERISHMVLFLIILALTVSLYHKAVPAKGQWKKPRAALWYLPYVAVLLSLGIFLFGFSRYQSEVHLRKAQRAWNVEKWKPMIVQTQKAQSPFYTMDPTSTPVAWYLGVAKVSLKKYNQALSDFLQAYRVNPYHLQLLANLGTCYELLGKHEMAIKYFKKALAVSPHY